MVRGRIFNQSNIDMFLLVVSVLVAMAMAFDWGSKVGAGAHKHCFWYDYSGTILALRFNWVYTIRRHYETFHLPCGFLIRTPHLTTPKCCIIML